MKKILRTSLLLFALTNFSSVFADEIRYYANGELGRVISFGTGDDGAFSDGPVQTGVTIAGATITFDTSVKSTFNFTSFTLTGANTLRAVGSNPLVIRVAGTALIQGTISVAGLVGGVANAGAPGTSGTPGAGGGTGGTGGKQPPGSAIGSDGLPRSGFSVGGSTPVNEVGVTTQMAGGGGCNGSSSGAGNSATAGYRFPTGAGSCSLTQALIAQSFDTTFSGGAGGGGGGTREFAANNMNGAGGGAGGGAIRISALQTLTLSGTITAVGGAGGAGTTGVSDFGSSGGGGSGGSIWLQTADRFTGSGVLNVTGGSGGADGTVTSVGGNGSRGVIRVDSVTDQFTGTITPAGAFDSSFSVIPITVGFNLKGGLACGTLTRKPSREESNQAATSFALGFGALLTYWIISRQANRRYF